MTKEYESRNGQMIDAERALWGHYYSRSRNSEFANFRNAEQFVLKGQSAIIFAAVMKILMDKILSECVEQAYEEARLGRGRDIVERDRVFGEVLAELEIAGDAMRYVDSKGRIAWKATERLRDYIEDLRLEAETEFEQENI